MLLTHLCRACISGLGYKDQFVAAASTTSLINSVSTKKQALECVFCFLQLKSPSIFEGLIWAILWRHSKIEPRTNPFLSKLSIKFWFLVKSLFFIFTEFFYRILNTLLRYLWERNRILKEPTCFSVSYLICKVSYIEIIYEATALPTEQQWKLFN